MQWIAEYGYFGMFLLGFLASTLVPIASEWLLVALLLKGLNPVILLMCATGGNFLGACTTYVIGYYGSDYMIKKVMKMDDEKRARTEARYKKYGSLSLLFSWLPVIGDPLCLVGGLLKINFAKYAVLVFIGKFIRYGATVLLVRAGVEYFI